MAGSSFPPFVAMRWFLTISLLLIWGLSPGSSLAAESHAEAGAEHAEHASGLPPDAPVLFQVGPLPVTNSMVVTWVVALALVVAVRRATGNMQLIPQGRQNFWEWLVESLYDFVEGVIGPQLVKKTFWFFATIFILIVTTNWFGLLPGVGTIGYGIPVAPGSHNLAEVTHPILRGANADFNMTFAMALIFFLFWIVWAVQANGIGGFLQHLFAPKGDTTGWLKLLMIFVFFAVGILEVVSILFRPISLSFRLYGNVFAGENMLEAMTHLGGPLLGWLTALPFYFLELLVGVVQALVFMLLTAVFTLLICEHDEEHAEAAHH
jgi:F-type H+-transporting ATPase subunit a